MKRHWKKIVGAVVAVDRSGRRRLVHLRQGVQQGRPCVRSERCQLQARQRDHNRRRHPASDSSEPAATASTTAADLGTTAGDPTAPQSTTLAGGDIDRRRRAVDDQGRFRGRLPGQGEHQRFRHDRQRSHDKSITGSMVARRNHDLRGPVHGRHDDVQERREQSATTQFNGRVMDVDNFPTSTFVLTAADRLRRRFPPTAAP